MKKSRLILIGLLGFFSCTTENDTCCEVTVVPIEIPAVVVDCEEANALSFVGVDCPFDAPDNSLYTEILEGELRNIMTNTVQIIFMGITGADLLHFLGLFHYQFHQLFQLKQPLF